MKVYRGIEGIAPLTVNFDIRWGKWSASWAAYFTPGTHCTGFWKGPVTGVDDLGRKEKNVLPCQELRARVCSLQPAAESLYWRNTDTSVS